MRILYYSTAYHAAHGGSSHARAFVDECRRHPDVTAISIFPDEPKKPFSVSASKGLKRVLKCNPMFLVPSFFRRNQMYQNELRERIKSFQPDVVHIRLDSNLLQIDRIKQWFPTLLISTEVNASPFDESFRNIAFRSIFRGMERKFLAKTDVNFFVSSNLRSRIMGESADELHSLVVHNGVDPERFRPLPDKAIVRQRMNISEGEVVLGYIGTLDFHKEVDILLRAFQQVIDKVGNVRLMIVGDGPAKRELEALSRTLGVGGKVVFEGRRPHDEMCAYINCFDVAIHHRAGDYMSPLKLFEYMACGVPVIGPSTPAVQEVFQDGIHLLVVDATIEDLVSKSLLLIADAQMREKLGVRARKYVIENYTWERNASFIISNLKAKLRGKER